MIPNLSWGNDFDGLTRYLVEYRDHATLDLRGVSTIDRAAAEMTAVASQSRRVKKPVMHVSMAAAIEDGVLPDEQWLTLLDSVDAEFGLVGHQRVVVRHRDKDYDHVHCFWCTIDPDTGRTPRDQWFRSRGASHPERDQHALSDAMRKTMPPDEVVRGAFNRFALARLMSLCRLFEQEQKLRQLRGRRAAADARARGERRERKETVHRAERTGRDAVTDHGDIIRAALDQPDYPRTRAALNAAGFDLRPFMRTRRDGTVDTRGLVVYDMADPANRAPASAFDLPHQRYGWQQIEKRHGAGAAGLADWWRTAGQADPPVIGATPERRDHAALIAARDEHRRLEAAKRADRQKLRERHRAQRERRRRLLRRLRSLRAARLASSARRNFYAEFAKTTRALIWGRLLRRQAAERAVLKRGRMPTRATFARTDQAAIEIPARRLGAVTSVPPRRTVSPSSDRVIGVPIEENGVENLEDALAVFMRRRQDLER